MREWWARLLHDRTGESVDVWNVRIRDRGLTDEATLRSWLSEQGVTGYPQMLLVMERFGYPDYLVAGAGELIDGQYADRPDLRPILDAILALAPTLGEVAVQARKTYVTLVSPRRTFALVKPATKRRVDLGMHLDGVKPSGRLEAAKGLGNETINLRIGLASPEDVDHEVVALLQRAYESNA